MQEIHLRVLPEDPLKLLSLGLTIGLSLALLVAAFGLGNSLLGLFLPYFTLHRTVEVPVRVNYTADVTTLSAEVKAVGLPDSFPNASLSSRVSELRDLMEPHCLTEPRITVNVRTYERYVREKNATELRKEVKYSLTCRLADLGLDWEEAITLADYLTLSFSTSAQLREQLEEEAKEKAREKADDEADRMGREGFLLYFGKKVVDDDVYCGSGPLPPVRLQYAAVAKGMAPAPQPGTSEAECYLRRTYLLYGIGFGSPGGFMD